MNKDTLKRLEFAGVFVCFSFWFLLYYFNVYQKGLLIKILFSPVNNSIWESFKLFLFGYVLWSGVELCWTKPNLRKFIVTKTLLLYIIGVCYSLIVPCFYILGFNFNMATHCVCIFITSLLYHYLSCKILHGNWDLSTLFIPCLLMLVAFALIFVSFTPYPPKHPVFYDFTTGIYGIPLENIDKGAVFLDRLYGI